ncbi:unnamed protein product [Effrenium voratum]|nr:unnamed protein product [Effrenium voratum]
MELELFSEALCDADPALLLGGAAGAADTGRIGRAAAWLADVRSALFQTSAGRKQQGSTATSDSAYRISQLGKALSLVADLLKAAPSCGVNLQIAIDALQEGARLGQQLTASATGSSVQGQEADAVEAIACAVRTKPPGGLLMVPTPFGLVILQRGGDRLASAEEFLVGVASSGPGLQFHPARPREDGDVERMQPLVLGKVPRARIGLGTFWFLACQPPKRLDGDELHPYAALLPFLTGVPADASPVRAPELSRFAHWRPISASTPSRAEAIQVVLDGLEFALRMGGATASQAARLARVETRLAAARQFSRTAEQRLLQELVVPACARHAVDATDPKDDDKDASLAPVLLTAIRELQAKAMSGAKSGLMPASAFPSQELPCLLSNGPVPATPADCEYPFFGPFKGDALEVAEEFAGEPLAADILSPPDLAEVGPYEVRCPADLIQLLGRAASSCFKVSRGHVWHAMAVLGCEPGSTSTAF